MRVGFSGYSDGAQVAVTVRQGGVSASASVDRWNRGASGSGPDSGGAKIGTITVAIRRSNLGVAPEGFQFEVTDYSGFDTPAPRGVFDERYHDFYFEWNFGDKGATYTVPTRLPDGHRNANVGYGPAAAHVYKKRGTYKVTCDVIELSSGKKAHWEQEVTIGDRENLFDGSATIYVDDDGKGAPPAGAQTVTTLKAALDLCKTQKALRRVMLRRGRKHAHAAQYDFRTSNNDQADWANVWVEAEPGAGARPVIDCTGDYGNGAFYPRMMSRVAGPGTLDMVWHDVVFQGQWDSTTESGDRQRCFWLYDNTADRPASEVPPDYLMFQGCTFSGFSQNIYGDKRGVQFLSDCHITNWQDYGWFGDTGRLSILGTKIEQHVDALSGGAKNGHHNQHGPLRFHHAEQMVIDGAELFTRNGWFPNVKGYTTIQPCIRFGMDSRPNDRLNLQRSLFEGGFYQVQITDTSGADEVIDVNVRIENCMMIGSSMTPAFVGTQFGGITVRNNVMVQPDVPRLSNIYDPDSLLAFRSIGISTGHELARTLVEFNSVVNLCSSANAARGKGIPYIIDNNGNAPEKNKTIIERNNLLYQPNIDMSGAPFDKFDSVVIAEPLYKGYRFKWERYAGELTASVAKGASFSVPYSEGDASYFATSDEHAITLGEATFRFGASSVTITNASGSAWPAGKDWVLTLERARNHLVPFDQESATPDGTVALFAPSPGQSGLGGLEKVDETVQVDFLGRERPPYLTIGALEPLP